MRFGTILCGFALIFLLAHCSGSLPPVENLLPENQAPVTATTGATKALIVFVKFQDDDYAGDACLDYRGWPLTKDPTQLPTYAHHLLHPQPKPDFPDSSLTDYFYQQSNQQFTLYGDVYPNVLTSDHPMAYYHTANKRGYGYLTEEILTKIDPDVDFSDYDRNPRDGVVDQIFIIVRYDPAITFTGVASLAGADRVAGQPRHTLRYDNTRVDWRTSGSYITHDRPGHIHSLTYLVRLMAHEYGHHLWNSNGHFRYGHIKSILSNKIPENNTNVIGYVLMAGRGGGVDARGDEIISAFERDVIGWGSSEFLQPRAKPQTITLGDLYATGDFKKIYLDDGNPETADPTLYIENRQPVGYFSQPLMYPNHPTCSAYDLGRLRTNGLLVSLALSNGQFDVLPADNSLALSLYSEDYAGDLYGPKTRPQITPWTRPSTARPPHQPTWLALDNIRYTDGPNGEMAFELIQDFRETPIIRADSWMGEETAGHTFASPVQITNGATLHLETSELMFKQNLVLEAESHVIVAEKSSATFHGNIILKDAATFHIKGEARIEGAVEYGLGAYVIVAPKATLHMPNGTVQAEDKALKINADHF